MICLCLVTHPSLPASLSLTLSVWYFQCLSPSLTAALSHTFTASSVHIPAVTLMNLVWMKGRSHRPELMLSLHIRNVWNADHLHTLDPQYKTLWCPFTVTCVSFWGALFWWSSHLLQVCTVEAVLQLLLLLLILILHVKPVVSQNVALNAIKKSTTTTACTNSTTLTFIITATTVITAISAASATSASVTQLHILWQMAKLCLQLWQQHCEPIKIRFPCTTCKIYHCDCDKTENSRSNINHNATNQM